MDTNDVAVATMTWARSPAEEAALYQSLEQLVAAGMPVAVADKSASATFATALSRLPLTAVAMPPEQGLVAQVQASIAAAAAFGRPFLLYTEPDKAFFFAHRLHDFLARVPAETQLGVALAGRCASSFDTFPPTQRYTEGVINHLCAEVLGAAGDYSYGPFVLSRALLPDVARVPPGAGWGWRHATFAAARRAARTIVHVTGDYPCPPSQQVEDEAERAHRMRQLSQNILGLLMDGRG